MFCYCWTMNKRTNCRTAKLRKWIIWDQYKRRKAGKSICVWKHFGLDPTHVLRLSDPGSCLLFRLGMISLKEQQGSRELAPRGAERRPPRLDVSTGHIPRALSSKRCSLATHHSSPQPQPPDPCGCRTCGRTAAPTARGAPRSLPEPHRAVPGCCGVSKSRWHLSGAQTHATEGKGTEIKVKEQHQSFLESCIWKHEP